MSTDPADFGHLDIARLPGLGRKVLAALRAQGIETVTDVLAHSIDALDAVPGIGKATASRMHLCAQAIVNDQPIWLNGLPQPCRSSGIMFDLETDPYGGEPWSLGWLDGHGAARVALVADNLPSGVLRLPDGTQVNVVPDTDTAWVVFNDSCAECDGPIYHWTGYDAGIMRRSAPYNIQCDLNDRMHDLHATFRRTVILPPRSTSLKPVARWLGFEWPEGAEGGFGWQLAWNDYSRWRWAEDIEALVRACRYQRADVDALRVVWAWLNGAAGQPVGE